MGRKHSGKRRNCLFRAIAPFSAVLSTDLCCRQEKQVLIWERVITKDCVIRGQVSVICLLLNPFPNKPWFLCVCSASLLKTMWEKEKLLVTSHFFFSHSVFYLPGKLSAIFITQNCRLQTLSLEESKICRFWKWFRFQFG